MERWSDRKNGWKVSGSAFCREARLEWLSVMVHDGDDILVAIWVPIHDQRLCKINEGEWSICWEQL